MIEQDPHHPRRSPSRERSIEIILDYVPSSVVWWVMFLTLPYRPLLPTSSPFKRGGEIGNYFIFPLSPARRKGLGSAALKLHRSVGEGKRSRLLMSRGSYPSLHPSPALGEGQRVRHEKIRFVSGLRLSIFFHRCLAIARCFDSSEASIRVLLVYK